MANLQSDSKIEWFRKHLGLPIAIIVSFLVWLTPIPKGLSPVGHQALVLFSGIFILYLTEAVPLPVTSFAIPPLAVLLGVVKVGPSLAPFGSSSVFLMFGAFVLAAAMIETNLAKRITYIVLSYVGGSTRNITFGVTVASIILTFLIPSSTARVAILLPVCISIIGLFKKEGRTKFGANLLLTLTLTNATIAAGILTGTVPNPVTVAFIEKAGGPTITYLEWLKIGFPPALVITFLTWGIIQVAFKPEEKEIPGGSAFIKQSLKDMGPMYYREKYTLVVFICIVILWAAGSTLKIDSTTACLFGTIFLFLPRFGVLSWKDAAKHVSYNVLLITGGGLSLGGLLMSSGAAKWLASTAFTMFGLKSLPVVIILLVVMFICQFMHFFFVGTTVMTTAMLPMVIALGLEAGVPAQLFALPAGMIMGGYPVLMFYCTNPNILVYSTGELTVGDFPKVGIPISIAACLIYAICAVTYWQWIGMY